MTHRKRARASPVEPVALPPTDDADEDEEAPAAEEQEERGAGGPRVAEQAEKVLEAAGSFTGLWALTWLGANAFGASAALQGGFAVGGVMAASGLTVLWWKTRTLRVLHDETETSPGNGEGVDPEHSTKG